jgi:hypothetical protein
VEEVYGSLPQTVSTNMLANPPHLRAECCCYPSVGFRREDDSELVTRMSDDLVERGSPFNDDLYERDEEMDDDLLAREVDEYDELD